MTMQCIGYYPLLVLQYSRGMDAQDQETWQQIGHAAHGRRNISGKKSITQQTIYQLKNVESKCPNCSQALVIWIFFKSVTSQPSLAVKGQNVVINILSE